MQDWQEKLKNALQISDSDIALIISGDFKTLLKENKNGAIRVLAASGACFLALFVYLVIFSSFGGLMRVILTTLVFGGLGFAGWKFLGKEKLIEAGQIKPLVYFASALFGFWTLYLFQKVTGEGSGWSMFLAILIVGGLAGGLFFALPKLVEKGLTAPQVILSSLALTAVLFSYQSSFIRISIDSELDYARRSLEALRLRDAENMRKMSTASQKVCTTEEECKRMNVKQNEYYAKYESDVSEACEAAVAKEITTRFEWTVSPKTSKFTDYKVDALNDLITVTGTKAQLISDDGTKTPLSYACRYNTKTRITQVSIRQ